MTAAALGASELFFNHIWMVPYYVVKGDLDRLLTYPVDPLSFLLVTKPELHSFGNLISGFLLAGISLHRLEAPWTAYLLLPLLVFCGCLVYTAALVMAAAVSFRFIGPTSLHLMIPHTLLQAARYPLSIYPAWLKFGLMFLVPFGAFIYFPASFLLGKDSVPWMVLAAPLAALLFLWAARRAWDWGLSRYESTGS
jgi:ABC-2 type transport system permease protein